MMIDKPGFYPDLPLGDYFADPCPQPSLTRSAIVTLNTLTPAHMAYEHPRLTPDAERHAANAAMLRGELVHRLALGKGRDFEIGDFADYRTKAAGEWKAEVLAQDRIPVLATKFAEAEVLADKAREAIERACNGADYETEVALIWQEPSAYGPIWCRALMDVWVPQLGRIIDLKITGTVASEDAMRVHFRKQGWHVQSRWYSRGVVAVAPQWAGRVDFQTLVVEAKPPHCHRAFRLDGEYATLADSQISEGIDFFAGCLSSFGWPGWPEEPTRLTPPKWALGDWIEGAPDA